MQQPLTAIIPADALDGADLPHLAGLPALEASEGIF
jgi:hypothetical protein